MVWFILLTLCLTHEVSAGTVVKREEILHKLDSFLDDDTLLQISELLQQKKDQGVKCEDDPSVAAACPHWKAGGACKQNRDTMKQYCRKTCDECRPPAPPIPKVPDCAKTQFGCCWDNVTIARGPVDNLGLSQCSPCLDRQSRTFCNNWKMDCGSKVAGQGDVMRKLCPITCGVPCDYNLNINKCRDDPAHLQNCIAWYADGKCTTEQAKMRVYCPAMCGFCHKIGR